MRKQASSVLLDIDLFYDILDFLILHEDANSTLYMSIQHRLMDKLSRMAQHDYYTEFKTARTNDDKAAAFNQYLNEIGMPEELRWGCVRTYLDKLNSGQSIRNTEKKGTSK